MKMTTDKKTRTPLANAVERDLKRAARQAHKTARMHGTPVYVYENGRVVARQPWLDLKPKKRTQSAEAPPRSADSSPVRFLPILHSNLE